MQMCRNEGTNTPVNNSWRLKYYTIIMDRTTTQKNKETEELNNTIN